ncbi:MAG: hypothetical protein OES20_14920, partial [Gammaproteobacteria bacterium]|nr:hypothetical protein [Gammaproteobacteria bacterium]
LDQNGKIEKREWKAIRAAARKLVLNRLNSEHKEHHVMSRPENGDQPYILSATPEEDLLSHKKWRAGLSVSAAFLAFTALIVMFSIRAPFSI